MSDIEARAYREKKSKNAIAIMQRCSHYPLVDVVVGEFTQHKILIHFMFDVWKSILQ